MYKALGRGNPLSTILFNMVLEELLQRSEINRKWRLFGNGCQCLVYAENVLLLVKNKSDRVNDK